MAIPCSLSTKLRVVPFVLWLAAAACGGSSGGGGKGGRAGGGGGGHAGGSVGAAGSGTSGRGGGNGGGVAGMGAGGAAGSSAGGGAGRANGGSGVGGGAAGSGGIAGAGGAASTGGLAGTGGAVGAAGAGGSTTAGSGGRAGSAGSGGAGGGSVVCTNSNGFTGRDRCANGLAGGDVIADQQFADSGTANTILRAQFESSRLASKAGCTDEVFGQCVVHTCPTGTQNGDGGVTTAPTAGAITVSSASKSVMVTADTSGKYTPGVLSSALYAEGATITFSAAGGDVPAFADSVCAPPQATITQPSGPGPLTVRRTEDYAVKWTGGGGVGYLNLSITDQNMSGTTRQLECNWDPSLGQGTVPKEALMKLTGSTGAIASFIVVRTKVTAGSSCVELTASNLNKLPGASGTGFAGGVVLQ